MPPNDFGNPLLVEDCRKLSISELLRLYHLEIKKAVLESQFTYMGIELELTTSKTGFEGIRFWFKCPICGKRSGTLYQHPLAGQFGCRNCLGLKYRQNRYKGMPEGIS